MRAFAILAALLLLLPYASCEWTQPVDVSVQSSNGMPVSGATIRLIYQKANGITSDDGREEGKTGEDGHYRITLENSVPAGLEKRQIEVFASMGGWQGKAQSFEAGEGTIEAKFTAPLELEKVSVIVLQSNGKAAQGASVYMSSGDVKKDTDSDGSAVFYLPAGTEIVGFVSYGSEGEYFTGDSATQGAGGGKEIIVRLPKSGGKDAYEGSATLSVTFLGLDGAPLSGEKVVFYYNGAETPTYTDARGAASIDYRGSGEATAILRKNDYDYLFSYNVTAGQGASGTAVLYPLLKIDYLESVNEGDGCYKVSAKVSDPRANRPVYMKMVQVRDGKETELPVEIDENGFYTARLCASEGTLVKAVASNSYETSERTISVSYVPQPSQPAPDAQQNATSMVPQPIRPTSPSEGLEVVFVLVVLLAVVFAGAVFVLGKNDPQAAGGMFKYFTHGWGIVMASTVRPIVEYVRSILKKREKPPPVGGPMFPRE